MGVKLAFRIQKSLSLVVLIALLGLAASGCNYRARTVLYKMPEKIDTEGIPVVHLNKDTTDNLPNYQHTIQPDDKIGVRFLNNNDISSGVTMTGNNSSNQEVFFLVDQKGFVKLPMVGKVQIAGLTKDEASQELEFHYRKNFKNPNIEVTVLNLSVSIEGEVKSPGVYPLQREKTALVEIIAAAGGLTAYAKKNQVKVIRRSLQGEKPEVLIFDLTQIETLEREELILRDKDIVYVEPRNIRVVGEAISPYASIISLVSTLATITVVIVNLSTR